MGSFTEAVLSFDLRPDVPDEVLASVSRLASAPLPSGSPPLPAPVEDEDWWPDDDELQGDTGPAPWRHDWSGVLSSAMGIGCTPYGQLAWSERGRWNLACRFNHKCAPEEVLGLVAWWAPFLDEGPFDTHDRPVLLGHLVPDGAPRPFLVWLHDGTIELEDLNPDSRWSSGKGAPNRFWEAASLERQRPPTRWGGRLTVVGGLPGSGKSTHLRAQLVEHPEWVAIDDFQADAIDHLPYPLNSRHWGRLVRSLREGKQVIVADTRYCSPQERRSLADELGLAMPGIEVTFVTLAADVEACRRNILDRAARSVLDPQPWLDSLDTWSRSFGAADDTIPVRSDS